MKPCSRPATAAQTRDRMKAGTFSGPVHRAASGRWQRIHRGCSGSRLDRSGTEGVAGDRTAALGVGAAGTLRMRHRAASGSSVGFRPPARNDHIGGTRRIRDGDHPRCRGCFRRSCGHPTAAAEFDVKQCRLHVTIAPVLQDRAAHLGRARQHRPVQSSEVERKWEAAGIPLEPERRPVPSERAPQQVLLQRSCRGEQERNRGAAMQCLRQHMTSVVQCELTWQLAAALIREEATKEDAKPQRER